MNLQPVSTVSKPSIFNQVAKGLRNFLRPIFYNGTTGSELPALMNKKYRVIQPLGKGGDLEVKPMKATH